METHFIDFSIREKAVVESARVLPVALGVPLLFGGLLAWRQTRRWQAAGDELPAEPRGRIVFARRVARRRRSS